MAVDIRDHDPSQIPSSLELPTSAEEIQTSAEAERIFGEALLVISDAVQREFDEHPNEDPSDFVTDALNAGRIPPIAKVDGVRGSTNYDVFHGAITSHTYQGIMSPTLRTTEVFLDTGERRPITVPLVEHLGLTMGCDQPGVDIATPNSWGDDLNQLESPETILRQDGNTAFALGTVIRAWQENPQPLPVL